MSKTMLGQVRGYTPVIDRIVKEDGLVTAAVFGVVWRFCQMSSEKCWASQEKIANTLKLSRQSVNGRLEWLVDNDYLSVIRTGNGTNVYTDTGKASLQISVDALVDGELDEFDVKELSGGVKNFDSGVKEIDTKKVLKKEVNKQNTSFSNSSQEQASPSENKDQFSETNTPLNEEPKHLEPSNVSKEVNSEMYLNSSARPEPTREPCDMDGITESMNLGYGGVKKKGLPADVSQFANAFVELAGVKFPRIENGAKDYKRYNATWWTPIKDMLYEVDGDVQVAIDILGRAMESLSKIDKMPAMPKQVINTYITEIAKGKRAKPKEKYLDPYGNVVEI